MHIAGQRIAVIILAILMAAGLETRAQDQAAPLPTVEQQIEAAVSAAPPNKKEGAGVLGYNEAGELVTLREGTNELICIADNPEDPKFHVACYYEGLEPFMQRGRELRAEGYSAAESDSIRRAEIESGELSYPQRPMGLYSLSGPEGGYDYDRGRVVRANPLYVVYVPYATERSSGISAAPAGEGGSWLMEPGTPWAHIMIPGRPIDNSGDSD